LVIFIPTYIPSNKLTGFQHILDIYSTKVILMLVVRDIVLIRMRSENCVLRKFRTCRNLQRFRGEFLSLIDPLFVGFGVIFPSVMIFSSGQSPSENIITSGNITPNPTSGGSINDILYRKLKNSLRVQNKL
jgi:hypothetical protein